MDQEIMTTSTINEREKRHCAFWNAEPCDRPMVLIHRPRTSDTQEDRELDALKVTDLQRYGTDPDILVRRARQDIRRTQYLGDALPLFRPPLGPTMLSAFLGARVEVAPHTVWFHSTVKDLADLENLSLDPSNRWWKLTEECALRTAEEPDAIPVVPGLGSLGDNLAALIGGETLMFEMMERPELVKTVLRRMLDIALRCYARLFEIAQRPGLGTANWLGLWSPQKTGILENDFSIMISTEMYQEFFAEEFRELSALLDHRIFHVDGTRSQDHIEPFLLKIPGLHGCQLGSNPGTRAMEILPTIKNLQAHGKRVFTYVFPDEVETLFEQISPRGVCVITSVPTNDDADRLIERLTKVCAKHQG